jgi:hypothetical protein
MLLDCWPTLTPRLPDNLANGKTSLQVIIPSGAASKRLVQKLFSFKVNINRHIRLPVVIQLLYRRYLKTIYNGFNRQPPLTGLYGS